MKPFKISLWPSAKSTTAAQRRDIPIEKFEDLYTLFAENVKPVANKVDQPIITRRRQESRSRENIKWKPPYLITLDYDSTTDEPKDVHESLIQADINHFIVTTWTHKTIETPQKKNNGLNCFKVFLEANADNENELFVITKGLAHLTGKEVVKKVDDISSGIFLGGTHPDFIDQFETFYYDKSKASTDDVKFYLKANAPAEEEVKKTPLDDFEIWDKTQGQKWTPERIKRALATIKYDEVEGFSRMALWYSIGYALHSTGDDDNFNLWDEWCLDNCSEHGVYNYEENEQFWAKQSIPDDHQKLCTLSTLWHLEKLFKAKEDASAIRQTSWGFFNKYAEEEPEQVKFLIEGLLVEKSIGFLVGTGGVGKSSMCLEIAKSISSGNPLFGKPEHSTMKGTVAIINKEDSHIKVHNQIHNLIALDMDRITRDSPQADFAEEGDEIILSTKEVQEIKDQWMNVASPEWSQSSIRLTNQDGEDLEAMGAIMGSLKKLQEELVETGRPPLSLVIFDPLNLWHGGDQNSQRDMGYIFSAFQQIQRDLDTAVLIVHHKNKSNGFSGSHTIRDSGRFMWELNPTQVGKEVSDKYIDFYVNKNNDAKANYTAMQFVRTDKGLLDLANLTVEEEEK